MLKLFWRLASDTSGATANEYGLIVVLIGCGIIAGASAVGANINGSFNTVKPTIGGP